jgi:hypothetical protein
VYPIFGKYAASGTLHGPGLLLDGGGAMEAPNASLQWRTIFSPEPPG